MADDSVKLSDADKELLLKALGLLGDKIDKMVVQSEKAGLTATSKTLVDAQQRVENLKTKIL